MGLFSNNQNKHGLISKFKKLYRKCCVPEPEDCCTPPIVLNEYNVKIIRTEVSDGPPAFYTTNLIEVIYDENVTENGPLLFNNSRQYFASDNAILVVVTPLNQNIDFLVPTWDVFGNNTPIIGDTLAITPIAPITANQSFATYLSWDLLDSFSAPYTENLTINIAGSDPSSRATFVIDVI